MKRLQQNVIDKSSSMRTSETESKHLVTDFCHFTAASSADSRKLLPQNGLLRDDYAATVHT